jgi:hypothetical protein
MAIELNYTNNLTIYVGAYGKIVKFEDDTINRILKVQIGFFVNEEESHSTNRIISVDEIIFDGTEYSEIQENYAVNPDTPRKNAYEKLSVDYALKYGSITAKQNIVDGIERPYRDEVLKEKQIKDDDFKLKGDDYIGDPTAPKKAVAQASLDNVILQQNLLGDVMYGANGEYPDKPIKYSSNFDVALSQIPQL